MLLYRSPVAKGSTILVDLKRQTLDSWQQACRCRYVFAYRTMQLYCSMSGAVRMLASLNEHSCNTKYVSIKDLMLFLILGAAGAVFRFHSGFGQKPFQRCSSHRRGDQAEQHWQSISITKKVWRRSGVKISYEGSTAFVRLQSPRSKTESNLHHCSDIGRQDT